MMDNKNEEKEDEIKEKVKEPKREYKKRTIYKNILKENDEDLGKKEENKYIRESTEKRYKRKFYRVFSNDNIEENERSKNEEEFIQKDENLPVTELTFKKRRYFPESKIQEKINDKNDITESRYQRKYRIFMLKVF